MIKTALIAALVLIAASQAFAQSARIATTIATQKHDPAYSLGRDFWFAPGQNDLDEGGKYIRIYITSPKNTTAYVECEGTTKVVPVSAYGIGTFNIPLSWEMKSSGVVENKAIHVFDPTDDICVNLMSHNPYSSDGMYCIPTIGWGTDYVVAAYASLFDGFGSYPDIPGEFTVSANQDNTIVEITPSCDLRQASIYPQNTTTVAYQRGKKFEDTLNRGQCIQFQPPMAQDVVDYDVTGTIIHSNKPIGIVGTSMCANIPPDWPYCDYVTDMIRPMRTWGETYYTTNPIQPKNMPLHDSAMYLMVASKNDQIIHVFDVVRGDRVVCTIDSQYHIFWAEEANVNKWYSDAPFLLVQYINAATFPDGVNGNGDPAEAVMSPRESYPKTAYFIAPASVGAQAAYLNYANVIVNNNDIPNVTYDGKPIHIYDRQNVDDTFSIFLIPNVTTTAAHVVKSDSGVSVYLYGYGFDETFSWGGSSGVATINSPDTTPPIAAVSSDCFEANVHLADTGALASKLSEIIIDTDVNMNYFADTNFIAGVGYAASDYTMSVVDITKPAILKISAFDFAGNHTTVTSIYSPQIAEIEPPLQNFGSTLATDTPIVLYDTLINTGTLPIKLSNVSLLHGNVGFTIDSIGGSDTLAGGGHRPVKISFLPQKTTLAVDTIIYFDECFRYAATLVGSGGGADFFVSDANWKSVPLAPYPPGSWTAMPVTIHNLSRLGTIVVDTTGSTDRQHFVLLPKESFPIHLSAFGTVGDTASVWFYFEPTDLRPDTNTISWTSPQVKTSDSSLTIRNNLLIGNAVAPHLTFGDDSIVTINCPAVSDSIVHFIFVLSNSGNGPSAISKVTMSDTTNFFNLTGRDEHGLSWNPTRQSENLLAGENDTFTVDFRVKQNTNISATTTITAIGIPGDTLGDSSLSATVNVNYWAAEFSSGSLNFGVVPSIGAKVSQTLTITNSAKSNLRIYDIESSQPSSPYSYTSVPPWPVTLPPTQILTVYVTFDPSRSSDSVQNDAIQFGANWCKDTTIPLHAMLSSSGVAEEPAPQSTASIVQLGDGHSIHIIIPSDWPPPVRLDIYNILGEKVFNSSFDASAILDLNALARGVYFYRLRDGEINQTGKILLGQ